MRIIRSIDQGKYTGNVEQFIKASLSQQANSLDKHVLAEGSDFWKDYPFIASALYCMTHQTDKEYNHAYVYGAVLKYDVFLGGLCDATHDAQPVNLYGTIPSKPDRPVLFLVHTRMHTPFTSTPRTISRTPPHMDAPFASTVTKGSMTGLQRR